MGEPQGVLATLSWRQEDGGDTPRLVFDGHLASEADLEGLRVPAGTVVLDFAELSGIDRGGVRALLSMVRRLRIDQSVSVERCPQAIAEILQGNPALAMRLPIESTLEGSTVPEPSKPEIPAARRAERHRVHLQVRYRTAEEFVKEYADNLSRGGLFIQGASDVTTGRDVEVELELPGRGVFLVRGVVRNVLEADDQDSDQRAGAGVELVDAPPEFQDALTSYLAHLGRRRDAIVLVTNKIVGNYLGQFGYLARLIDRADALMTFMARSEHPVVGIVVSRREQPAFMKSAAEHGLEELVTAVDYLEEIEPLVPDFDDRLPL